MYHCINQCWDLGLLPQKILQFVTMLSYLPLVSLKSLFIPVYNYSSFLLYVIMEWIWGQSQNVAKLIDLLLSSVFICLEDGMMLTITMYIILQHFAFDFAPHLGVLHIPLQIGHHSKWE